MKGLCHMESGEQMILKRHSVDHLYKEKKAKDQMLNLVEHLK